jgi:hypothetical protein
MKVIYNQPIPVKAEHYNMLMSNLSGIIAGRKDASGQHFIKLLCFPYRKYVQQVIDVLYTTPSADHQ